MHNTTYIVHVILHWKQRSYNKLIHLYRCGCNFTSTRRDNVFTLSHALSHQTHVISLEAFRFRRFRGQFHRLVQGGGTRYKAIEVCATPSGSDFAPFWSENGYSLCPFWSGIGYGFLGNFGSVWTYLSFQLQMSKKRKMRIRTEFVEFFCFHSNLSSDNIISA